jgi:hypothetical protein
MHRARLLAERARHLLAAGNGAARGEAVKPSGRINQIVATKMAAFVKASGDPAIPGDFMRRIEHEAVVEFLDEKHDEFLAIWKSPEPPELKP